MSREARMAIIVMVISMAVVAAVAPFVFDYFRSNGFVLNWK